MARRHGLCSSKGLSRRRFCDCQYVIKGNRDSDIAEYLARAFLIMHPLGRVGSILLGSIERSSLPQPLVIVDIKTAS